jgi:hypothetical protein
MIASRIEIAKAINPNINSNTPYVLNFSANLPMNMQMPLSVPLTPKTNKNIHPIFSQKYFFFAFFNSNSVLISGISNSFIV